MRRSTLTRLALLVFALVLLSFVVRGLARLLVGPRTAVLIAGPIAIAAVGVLLVVLGAWTLSRLGLVSLTAGDDG